MYNDHALQFKSFEFRNGSEAESLMKKLLYILEFKYLSAIALLYPPFLLMILVQNFMLLKNRIETWV